MGEPRYPHIKVRLIGGDGSAFSLMCRVGTAMRRHKVHSDEIDALMRRAMSGDHDHLLRVVREAVNVTCNKEESI